MLKSMHPNEQTHAYAVQNFEVQQFSNLRVRDIVILEIKFSITHTTCSMWSLSM